MVFGLPNRLIGNVADSDDWLRLTIRRGNPGQIALERSCCITVELNGQRVSKAREVQSETLTAGSGTDLHCR